MKQNKQRYFYRKDIETREKKKWSTAVFYPKKGGSVVLFPF